MILLFVVLPPVLVPRNPQVITSVYEPIPSYLDSGRPSYSPNNDVHTLNFDTPGEQEAIRDPTLNMDTSCHYGCADLLS